jgi:hypothetical protein
MDFKNTVKLIIDEDAALLATFREKKKRAYRLIIRRCRVKLGEFRVAFEFFEQKKV